MELLRRILFEDNHLIIINKKAGELVQGDKTEDLTLSDLIKSYLKKKYNKPGAAYLGVVHRLDRPTSGVLIFAKTSKALRRLNQQFKSRLIKKIYWALVDKNFTEKEGYLSHWLIRNEKQNKSKAYINKVPNSKKARLNFKRIRDFDQYCLLEIDLETGRHHQIRAQLTSMGFPIQGDLKYGAARPNKDRSIGLHGYSLSLKHPVTEKLLNFKAVPLKAGIWKSVLYDLPL
ncbi:MAG: RNA pseudouridine synthase [Flavobacteriaceae bacterium]|nr:RNA pseudouridine synthase [Flavobacteriaceae bacterium]